MSVNIYTATRQDAAEIDRFLENNAAALAFHSMQWLEAIRTVYQHDYVYLFASEGDHIVGVLPLCLFKGLSGKVNFCSLPYCDIGGVVSNHDHVKVALVNFAVNQLESNECDHLELRQRDSGPGNPDDLSGHKVSMLLDLPPNPEMLMQGFKSKLRSQIRKAQKNGLSFEFSNDKAGVKAFYQVFARNMRDLGSPAHSLKWFEALQQGYGNKMLVGKVYHDGLIIGAGIVMFSGKTASIPWASTLREYNHLAPNMWLYWSLLRISCEAKIQLFDFGRSSYGEGTYKFKAQWGARPVPLDWNCIDRSGRTSGSSSVAAGAPRQLVEFLWKRFPLNLANCLGPILRKRISL